MNISHFLKWLLRKLERFYRQVALARLHKLMDRYHKHASHGEKRHAKDIKSSLLDYVDNIVVVEKEKTKTKAETKIPHDVSPPVSGGGVFGKHVAKSHHALYPFNIDTKQVGELSKYFKARKRGAGVPPGIDEKLKSSVWDHINASVQCALRGDKHNAKMHVDIANYAFKELEHHMPEGEYLELTRKINKRLDDLKADQ